LTRYYWIAAVDTSGNVSATEAGPVNATTAMIATSDIGSFAIDASKIFTKIPIITGDSWTNNSPIAGSITWNAHTLIYNGVSYSIATNNTALKYTYWIYGNAFYTSSNTHPASILTDNDFIIAVNNSGVHDLAWNAIANEVIGSSYIANAAIVNAKIGTAAVDSLQIAGNAVTVPVFQVIPGTIYGTGVTQVVAGPITITNSDTLLSMKVSILFNARMGYTSGTSKLTNFQIYRGATLIANTFDMMAFVDLPTFAAGDTIPPSTAYDYYIYWYGEDSTVALYTRSILIQGVKR